MSIPLNRVKMSVTGDPVAGDFTLNNPLVTFQSIDAAGGLDGQTFTYLAKENSSWELGPGVYTAAGTILARCNPADPAFMSSSGGAINFTTACIVEIILSAQDIVALTPSSPLLGAPWSVPMVADFTLFNQDTVVYTDNPAGININYPALGFELRGGYKASPGATFTVYMRMDHTWVVNGNNSRYGILLRNSALLAGVNRLMQLGWYIDNGTCFFILSRWTTDGVVYVSGTGAVGGGFARPNWIKVTVDATEAKLYVGDGYNWSAALITETLTGFITAGSGTVDGIGFCAEMNQASMMIVNSFDITAPIAGGGGQV